MLIQQPFKLLLYSQAQRKEVEKPRMCLSQISGTILCLNHSRTRTWRMKPPLIRRALESSTSRLDSLTAVTAVVTHLSPLCYGQSHPWAPRKTIYMSFHHSVDHSQLLIVRKDGADLHGENASAENGKHNIFGGLRGLNGAGCSKNHRLMLYETAFRPQQRTRNTDL